MKRLAGLVILILVLAVIPAWASDAQRDLKAGYLALEAGDDARAVELYTRAIEVPGLGTRRLASAYFNRALAQRRLGKLDLALSDYNQAVELWPSYARAYNNRGYLYLLKGNNVQALRDLSQSLMLQPDNPLAHVGLGVAYQRIAMYDWAEMEFKRAIEVNPNYVEAYQRLAWLLATCPKPKYRNGARAVCLAQRAVFLKPSPMNYDALAAAYAEIGRFDLAQENQRKALARLRQAALNEYHDDFSRRLSAYMAGRPWRESTPAAAR